MSVSETEALLGARGTLQVTSDNKLTVRKWLTANGVPGMFAACLSRSDLQQAYNDKTDAALDVIKRHAAKAAEEEGANEEAAPQASNGHANGHYGPNGGQASLALIRDILLTGYEPKATVDENTVRKIVADALANITPQKTVIEVRQDDKPAVQIDGRVHPIFERVLRLLKAGAKVMLVGPAGCGKTTLCAQLAKALSVDYGVLSGSGGASEGEIKGWLLPVDGGKFEYCPSDFVSLYERGNYLHLFDEIDGFDPNMLLSINCAVENGHFSVAIRRGNPIVSRGKNVFIIASANTFGTGANPIYCGRNPMDEATRDRFVIVTMDYDTELEKTLAQSGGLSDSEIAWLWELRDKARNAQLRRVVSTRAFQKAAMMKAAGDDWGAIKATLTAGWSRDELAKVGA